MFEEGRERTLASGSWIKDLQHADQGFYLLGPGLHVRANIRERIHWFSVLVTDTDAMAENKPKT